MSKFIQLLVFACSYLVLTSFIVYLLINHLANDQVLGMTHISYFDSICLVYLLDLLFDKKGVHDAAESLRKSG